MELVKMSHGMQKFTNVVFLNTKKNQLELVFGDNFANYISVQF